jgi:hypothetical protein
MRSSTALISLFACVVAPLATAPQQALADTFPFVAGMQTNSGFKCMDWNYFSEGAIGIVKNGQTQSHFIMPVYWRTFPSGTRTVRVRGKLNSAAGNLSCDLFVFDANGFVVSQNAKSFSFSGGSGSYAWVDLSVTGITTTTNSFISCGISDGGNAYLMMMSYTP